MTKAKFFSGNFLLIPFICLVYIACSKCIKVGYLSTGIVEIVKQLVFKVINGVVYIMKTELKCPYTVARIKK